MKRLVRPKKKEVKVLNEPQPAADEGLQPHQMPVLDKEEAVEPPKPPFHDALKREYDSFAAEQWSPDHAMSLFIKLHQILEYTALVLQEIKGLREDIKAQDEDACQEIQ